MRKSGKRKISVVIPALNEAATVANVVRLARANPLVGEVLVVDDGSVDGTPELATAAGARVITSSLLGKGVSMEEGLEAARFEILLYLDGDLRRLRRDTIRKMVKPLLDGEEDFIKARFRRKGGRVTELTAKPLLRTYFPELADFNQPLGGIIAGRRDLLRRLRFEHDYGVDIGLLIDAAGERARIAEVDIGHIRHDSKPLASLGEMATQVSRAILERAALWGRLRLSFLRAAREHDSRRHADLQTILPRLQGAQKLALFDMDGTLLEGRFVTELARHTGRLDQLSPLLDNAALDATTRTRRIAAIFKGVSKNTFENVARATPLMRGAVETIVGLRKAGYQVGVITDSYHIAAETIRRRVFADFCIANLMKFRAEKCTGALTLAPAMRQPRVCKTHRLCKLNALHFLLKELNVSENNVLVVGDSDNDACMLKAGALSVAFNPKTPSVRKAADHVVRKDLRKILGLAGTAVSTLPELRSVDLA